MTSSDLPREGACRCGKVRLRIDALPLITMACHCTGCQRMTGSAFSLSAAIPPDGFLVTEGEPVIGGLHGGTRHYFCPYCMSWLYTRPEGIDAFVNVRSPMLGEPSWSTPFIETMTREKLAWATTPAVHSFETWPDVDDYARLTAEYTEWAAQLKA